MNVRIGFLFFSPGLFLFSNHFANYKLMRTEHIVLCGRKLSTCTNKQMKLRTNLLERGRHVTRDRESEFVPNQKLPLFTWAGNFTLIVQYYLIPGTDSSAMYISKNCLFPNVAKICSYELRLKRMVPLFSTQN